MEGSQLLERESSDDCVSEEAEMMKREQGLVRGELRLQKGQQEQQQLS